VRSYKQLHLYQIQTKFRDEPRPKSGLLRIRQYIMKDSYTSTWMPPGLDAAYEKHYQGVFPHLRTLRAPYDRRRGGFGAMGGSQSHEFMVRLRRRRTWWRFAPVRLSRQSEKAVSIPVGSRRSRSRG